ncbi:MAG: DUF1330 domain-containing protein [Hyphomonadaceae bacterium]|nr:DUF1330 domain-containing protein [Hyphomonadaceae bacterium]MBC6411611.1 DUF1330 domain-containing protein [Hyphomonadaceae bacterium]
MPTLNAVDPTPEQIRAFLDHRKAGEPVYMLNLLKFREKAEYRDSKEEISGREAYQRYAGEFAKINSEKAETVFGGNANVFLIGEGDGEWDAVAVIRYGSAKKMFDAVSSEEYRKIHKHRRAGLAGQLLISCDGDSVF